MCRPAQSSRIILTFGCPTQGGLLASKMVKYLNCYLRVLYKCVIFAVENITHSDMNNAVITRKQTSFRLSSDLIERLQEEAKRHNRSLNNLVESVLMAFVSERPNKTTLAAMKEAESGKELETLDLSSFRSFVSSL